VAHAMGAAALEDGDFNLAVRNLRLVAAKRSDEESAFLLAVALWNRNEGGDRLESLNELVKITRIRGERFDEAAGMAVEGALIVASPSEGRALLEEFEENLEPCLRLCLRARVAVANGQAEITGMLTDALAARSDATTRATLKRLA